MEIEEAIPLRPLSRPERAGGRLPELLGGFSNRFFLGLLDPLADVTQDVQFGSAKFQPLECSCNEELWREEYNVGVVVGPSPMVGSLGERVRLTHGLPRFMVE